MINFKEMETKQKIMLALTAIAAVFIIVITVCQSTTNVYALFSAGDLVLRLVLYIISGIILGGALIYYTVMTVLGKDLTKALGLVLALVALSMALNIAITVLFLMREYENSSRLIENIVLIIAYLTAALIALICIRYKNQPKKLMIAAIIAAVIYVLFIIIDFAAFLNGAKREVSFLFIANRFLPFIAFALIAGIAFATHKPGADMDTVTVIETTES